MITTLGAVSKGRYCSCSSNQPSRLREASMSESDMGKSKEPVREGRER